MKKDKISSWPVEAKAGLALVFTSALIVGGALFVGNKVSNRIDPSDVGNVTSSLGSDVEVNTSSGDINSEVDVKVETLAKIMNRLKAFDFEFKDKEDLERIVKKTESRFELCRKVSGDKRSSKSFI